MLRSKVKSKLRKGEPALCLMLHFTDESVFELASLMGLDGIWMDMEHHTYSLETATSMIRAARIGPCDVIARPGKGEFMRMGRMLEAGAHGIMYPRCDNAAEAAEVVKWAKFYPLGKRGLTVETRYALLLCSNGRLHESRQRGDFPHHPARGTVCRRPV